MFDNDAMAGLEGWENLGAAGSRDAFALPGSEVAALPGYGETLPGNPAVHLPAAPQRGAAMAPSRRTSMVPMSSTLPQYHNPAAIQAQMAGQTLEWLEGKEAGGSGTARAAGVAAVILAGSFGVGVALGGPWGALAGILLAGTAMNGYRAQKYWGDKDSGKNFEAVSSAVFAAGGLLAGGYAAYQAYQSKVEKTSKPSV